MNSFILTMRTISTYFAPSAVGAIIGITVFFGKAMPVHCLLALPFIFAVLFNEIVIWKMWEPAEQLRERRRMIDKVVYYWMIIGLIVSSEIICFVMSYLFCVLFSKIF